VNASGVAYRSSRVTVHPQALQARLTDETPAVRTLSALEIASNR
jgi:hypothetical protein